MPLFGPTITGTQGGSLPPRISTPPRDSRSDDWSPPTGPTPSQDPLKPKTDTASLPGMVPAAIPHRGYRFDPVIEGGTHTGWTVMGPTAGMAMLVPLRTFPAGTGIAEMEAWVASRIATLAANKRPEGGTTDSKGLPTKPAASGAAEKPAGMPTGTKVALGTGAGLLALFMLKG